MKVRISTDLPDRAKLLAGLTPRDVHPPLVRAEAAATAAELALDRARGELADLDRAVAELPARISRGEVRAGELAEALRRRDATALMIGPAEAALTKAKEGVLVQEKLAAAAVRREFDRRAEILERAAAELAPVLEELHALSIALTMSQDPGAVFGLVAVDWVCSGRCAANTRAMLMSSAPATPALMWNTP